MKIAVEGCAHGELEKIYECIEALEKREDIKVDLLICCGDFQSVRNSDDLRAMAVPEKYQNMCTFYKYYSGEKRAPILTLFIGGNHEASNYLQELPYGGWVAPNIYYIGRSGVIRYGDLRIGGLSGIFKGRDYLQGLWESLPYSNSSLRTVYHVRSLDVFRLSQLKEKVHVMLSHDWPRGITEYGDVGNLFKKKPFLREDIESNQLGSVPAEKLLHKLKPDYWFAAHLHCQFAALVKHEDGTETKFLALDKCLPKRRHLQLLDIPAEFDGDRKLKHDAEWLAILKNTNHLLNVKNVDYHLPGPGGDERYLFTPTEEEKDAVMKLMEDLTIKEESFVQTAPTYQPNTPKRVPSEPIMNPQTMSLCEKLGIDDPVQVVMARSGRTMKQPCLSNVSCDSNFSTPVRTPMKIKMSLPAPATPIENDYEEFLQKVTIVSPDSSQLTNNKQPCLTDVSCDSNFSIPVRTPMKIKMSLPASESPIINEHEQFPQKDAIVSPDSSQLTNNKEPCLTNVSCDSNFSTPVRTPMKIKMSLPAPTTPIINDHEKCLQKDTIVSPDSSSILSNSTCSTTVDCTTPETPKRTFKRRNLAMYTPDQDDNVNKTSNSLLDSVSPRSSKSPYMGNVQ